MRVRVRVRVRVGVRVETGWVEGEGKGKLKGEGKVAIAMDDRAAIKVKSNKHALDLAPVRSSPHPALHVCTCE